MTQHPIAYRVAAAAAALVLLTACGDDDEDATASGSTSSAVDQPLSTPAGSGSASASESDEPTSSSKTATVEFDADEFKFNLSTTTFKAGEYTFTLLNVGKAAHALQIDGPGVEAATTGTIPAGGEGSVTVTLKKGTYRFSCPVGDHVSRGMENEITVT